MRPTWYLSALIAACSLTALSGQTPNQTQALIEGTAIDQANNTPLKLARVRLQRNNDEPVYARADAEGHFLFRNLAPGLYQMTVESPGYLQSRGTVDVGLARPAGRGGILGGIIGGIPANAVPRIAVAKTTDDDGTIHATATAPLVAAAAITGKVTDPYGAPLSGALLEIQSPRPERPNAVRAAIPGVPMPDVNSTSVTANGQGEFRAGGLQPGTYWVVVVRTNGPGPREGWESSYRPTYFPGVLSRDSAKALVLTAGQQARADIQVLKVTGVTITGHLNGLPPASPDGSARFNTQLTLTPEKSDVNNIGFPTASGLTDFKFSDVLPGKYTLSAVTYDPGEFGGPDRKALYGLTQQVQVSQQDMNGFDLTLQPLRGVTGTVELADGCTEAPQTLRLQGRSMGRMNEATVAADHTFVLENIPPGKFNITVVSRGMRGMTISSATKGDRDVLTEGLESPLTDDSPLKIKVTCQQRGVLRGGQQ